MLCNLNIAITSAPLPNYAVAMFTLFPALILGCVIGFFGYRALLKRRQIDANVEYNKVVEEARQEAENLRKDALVDAKQERIRLRDEFDKEIKDRRTEFQKLNRGLFKRRTD